MNHFDRKNTSNSGSRLYSVVKLLKIISCFYSSTYKPSFAAQWYSRVDFRVRVACFLLLFSSASARGAACTRASASDTILSRYWIQSNFWQLTRDPVDWQAVASGSGPDHMDFTPPTQRNRKNHNTGLIHHIQHRQQGQQHPVCVLTVNWRSPCHHKEALPDFSRPAAAAG